MLNKKKNTIICVLLFISSLIFSFEQNTHPAGNTAYNGLFGTLENILETRPPAKVKLGSFCFDVENIIDDNLNGLFSCDLLLGEYLNNNEYCTYDQLSYIIEEYLYNNIEDKTGSLYTYVNVSEDESMVFFTIEDRKRVV